METKITKYSADGSISVVAGEGMLLQENSRKLEKIPWYIRQEKYDRDKRLTTFFVKKSDY